MAACERSLGPVSTLWPLELAPRERQLPTAVANRARVLPVKSSAQGWATQRTRTAMR